MRLRTDVFEVCLVLFLNGDEVLFIQLFRPCIVVLRLLQVRLGNCQVGPRLLQVVLRCPRIECQQKFSFVDVLSFNELQFNDLAAGFRFDLHFVDRLNDAVRRDDKIQVAPGDLLNTSDLSDRGLGFGIAAVLQHVSRPDKDDGDH